MHVKMRHPNGINEIDATPQQRKRLLKLGYVDADTQPLKEAIKFELNKTAPEITETIKNCESGCCKTVEPEKQIEPEKTEIQADEIQQFEQHKEQIEEKNDPPKEVVKPKQRRGRK